MTHLSEEESQDPLEVIKSILMEVKPKEMYVMIQKVLEICLTTDQSFEKHWERYELILIFNKITRLIEAITLLNSSSSYDF